MIHNGIEYADMQFIGEAYDLLKGAGLSAATPRRPTSSRVEHRRPRLLPDRDHLRGAAQVDAETGKPLVDVIVDAAGMKGTGTWTVQEALNLGVPAAAIAEAVFARAASSSPELRKAARPLCRVRTARSETSDATPSSRTSGRRCGPPRSSPTPRA
jgi:6-phosphogluconate dehydrogenase